MSVFSFTLPLVVIGKLCSVTVAFPGHLPYYFVMFQGGYHDSGRRGAGGGGGRGRRGW